MGLRVGRPLVIHDAVLIDDHFLIAAVGIHGVQLAALQEGDALAVRGETQAGGRCFCLRQLRRL